MKTKVNHRAAEFIGGTHRARRTLARIAHIRRQLAQLAPTAVAVRTVPVTSQGRALTVVTLVDHTGRSTVADEQTAPALVGLLRAAFPAADWTKCQRYDTRAGGLIVDHPLAPADIFLPGAAR